MINNRIYLQIIVIPVLFILIISLIGELYNIYELNDIKEKDINKVTAEFTKKNKQKIHDKVHHVIKEIDFSRKNSLKNLKIELKTKVDSLSSVLNHVYEYHKSEHSEDELKRELLKMIRSHNKKGSSDYFFVIDIKTSKLLVNNIKTKEGKPLKGKIDQSGLDIFASKIKLLKTKEGSFHEYYFEKPGSNGKEFKKIVYIKKFENYNWIIGTGKYLDDYENKIKKDLVNKLNTLQKGLSDYVFISKIHNINGGKDFATMLVMPNKTELIGQKISDDRKDLQGIFHRKEYLKGLRENGEAYLTYFYKKVSSNEQGKKLSYFYYYEPWQWMIASGFYFDDLESQINYKKININKKIKEKLFNTLLFDLVVLCLAIIIFLMFARNITAQLRDYIKKIDRQRSNFKMLFNNSPDGIFLLKDKKIINCNNAILDMFVCSDKTYFKDKCLCVISPNCSEEDCEIGDIRKYVEICEQKGIISFEWKFQRLNSEQFDAEVTFTKINIDSGEIIYAVIKDISQKKKLEQESIQKDALMIQQSKLASMGEMIGNIAHQWRQPLNALSLTVQKIKLYHDCGKLTQESLDKSIDKSKMLILKMSTTIDDFRNFYKVDKVKVTFDIKKDAIEKTIELIEESLKSKGIFIHKEDIEDDIKYYGLKNEFEQVLLNIINNAKDALLENKIENPFIKLALYEKSDKIYIQISDNAGGIPKDIMNKIYEPYFTTKEQGKGTGIGLYMSKMIIQNNMAGKLSVKNDSLGACFTIILPKETN